MNSWGEVGGKLLKFSGCKGSNIHAQRRRPPCWCSCHCQKKTPLLTDLFYELLWYFLCPFLLYLESSKSFVKSLLHPVSGLLLGLPEHSSFLTLTHCICPLQIILHMAVKIISHDWHWDHDTQWLNPVLVLQGSTQINLPLLPLKASSNLNWICLFEVIVCHISASLSTTYLC